MTSGRPSSSQPWLSSVSVSGQSRAILGETLGPKPEVFPASSLVTLPPAMLRALGSFVLLGSASCFFSGSQARQCKERKEEKVRVCSHYPNSKSPGKRLIGSARVIRSSLIQPVDQGNWVRGQPGHVKHSYGQGPHGNHDRQKEWVAENSIMCS